DVHCTVPYGQGTIAVTGSISDLSKRSYDLALQLENVPVKRVLALIRRAKRDLPEGLSAEGLVDAQLTAVRSSRSEPAEWAGRANLSRVVLQSGETLLRLPSVAIEVGHDVARSERRGFVLTTEPFDLELGGEKPAT